MKIMKKTLVLLTAVALLLGAAPIVLPAAQAAPAGAVTHYTWNTVKTTGTDNLTALPTNVMYEAEGARTKAFQLDVSTIYGPTGPTKLTTYSMYNALGTYTNSTTGETTRYGLPYRIISRAHEFPAINENLWLELAQMPALDTTGTGAINLSMEYYCPSSSNTSNVAFSRSLQVYVSLDGETFLPGYAGVRSATLKGGGTVSNNGTACLMYQLETENLMDIPGVSEGDVIRRIKIMPNGVYCRTFGSFITRTISVNKYASASAFETAVPSDIPELIDLGEETMRAIVVAEGMRTASIPWTAPQDVTTTFPSGSSAYSTGTAKRVYKAGLNFRGPTYERTTDSTRELFESSIVDGVYGGYNGAGFDMSADERVYGMDCQTFVFNAISRVSRSYAWSVMNTFGETDVELLGDLTVNDHAAYSDVDVVELNTAQQMYESYALAQAGDVAIHYLTDNSNSVHTRVVKSVSVVRNGDGTIDPAASKMYCTEQSSTTYGYDSEGGRHSDSNQTGGWDYYSTSHADREYTFSTLRSSGYIVYTLKDYAAGKVETQNIQAVAAPLVKNGAFTDGMHLAFSSNYRIIKYGVTLHDVTNDTDLFTEERYCKMPNVVGINYENDTLNTALAGLPDGDYRIDLSVDSGPLLSTTQTAVPTTVKSFPFTVDRTAACTGNHSARKALTQSYLDSLELTAPEGNGAYWTLPSGSYYLSGDLSLSHSIRILADSEVTLCLNGHTLRGALAANSDTNRYYSNAFIHVAGTLNLCDHTDAGSLRVNVSGEITNKNYAAYAIQVLGGQLNFYSGSIRDSVGRYGVILVNGSEPNGEMNMYGGAISGNHNISGNAAGGAVELQGDGVLNMYDGQISGNGTAANHGTAVDANGSTGDGAPAFIMHGGVITGNVGGSGVVRAYNGGSIHVAGGTIRENTAGAGSVCVTGDGASLTVSGGVIGTEATAGAESIVFQGSAGDAVSGEFTGGTVWLPIATDGAADFDVSLQGGDFGGIADGHTGISVTGGRFADSANLEACGVGNHLWIVDTGNSTFPYAIEVGVPGDMTGDGAVGPKDVSMLQRFVARGYGVSLPTSVADLSRDGKVNGKDISLLQRYVAGGYGVELE